MQVPFVVIGTPNAARECVFLQVAKGTVKKYAKFYAQNGAGASFVIQRALVMRVA